MPIEIKELHIRVEVSAQPGGSPVSSSGAPATGPGATPADLETIVAACVEQVMQVLRDRRER
jgi:hypothetical protein